MRASRWLARTGECTCTPTRTKHAAGMHALLACRWHVQDAITPRQEERGGRGHRPACLPHRANPGPPSWSAAHSRSPATVEPGPLSPARSWPPLSVGSLRVLLAASGPLPHGTRGTFRTNFPHEPSHGRGRGALMMEISMPRRAALAALLLLGHAAALRAPGLPGVPRRLVGVLGACARTTNPA